MSQFISLAQAIAMTTLYRAEKENILDPAYQNQNILCRSETFDRFEIDTIMGQPGCEKLRIYYGMDETKKIHAILVGVNDKDEDLLPAEIITETYPPVPPIVDNAQRCPDDCPPASPLNP